MAPLLPPLESPPQVEPMADRFTVASPEAVDKLVVAALLDMVASIDTLGSTDAQALLPGRQPSLVAEVASVLQSLNMEKSSKELGALMKEIKGFERTITDNISKPLTGPLKSQISEVFNHQNKVESLSSQKAEVMAKSAKACASLKDQQAELEKQIRNWNRRAKERTNLPQRVEEEQEALRKETALIGTSEAAKAIEEKEKTSRTLAKTLKNERAAIPELKEKIKFTNGYRLLTLNELEKFLSEGYKNQLEQIKTECTQWRAKLNSTREERERCGMECEDCAMKYLKIEESGRASLRTSLGRATKIRELAGQKKDIAESLSTRKSEVAARSAEVAYAGWWKSQLETELRNMQQRIIDSSPAVIEGNIQKTRDSITKFLCDTDDMIQKTQASLLKQEVYFHKRENWATRTLALQNHRCFEAQWKEAHIVRHEIELENLVASSIEAKVAKENQVANLKQELLRLISVGDDKQERDKLQKELNELSQHTSNVQSQMTYLEQLEKMIADAAT